MTKNKEGSFRIVGIMFFLTILIAFNWNNWIWLKDAIHSVLDPTVGFLLNWHLEIGMILVLCVLSLIMTFVQKYTTNQEELKKIRKIQKELQEESKKHQSDPKKSMEIQKEMMALLPKQLKLGMRTIIYTGIPFILFFKWFDDFFALMGNPKFFGFLGWFLFYIIVFMIFSSIFKKKFDVA